MAEAPMASISMATVIGRAAPPLRAILKVKVKLEAITRALRNTTPASPVLPCMAATAASKSHSQRYQVRPCMVAEKGSARGIERVSRISSPLRICQPVPASPRSRGARAPTVRLSTSRMKIRSATEGIRKRFHAAGRDTGSASCAGFDFRPSSASGCNSRLSPKASCYLIALASGMEGQKSDADAHVMQQMIGEAGGDGQAQQRMHETQGNNRSVTAKHLAEEKPACESGNRQHGIWQVNNGEQERGQEYGAAAADQRLHAQVEERLQGELLHERPHSVLPRGMPRHNPDGRKAQTGNR